MNDSGYRVTAPREWSLVSAFRHTHHLSCPLLILGAFSFDLSWAMVWRS